LPRPTAEPVAARINANRDDHSPWIDFLVSVISVPVKLYNYKITPVHPSR